jgi:hypothetical protein
MARRKQNWIANVEYVESSTQPFHREDVPLQAGSRLSFKTLGVRMSKWTK